MAVPLTVKEIETAVFSATEEADILHDRRSWRKFVNGDSITLSLLFHSLIKMPTVAVDKEELWERLGHRYCA